MSKLTCLERLPPPDKTRVGPHNYRRLGDKVLLANEAGRFAFLSEAEYREYLSGIDEPHPLWARLEPLGFLGHAINFDQAAASLVETGLLGWRGPLTHVLALEAKGRRMSPEAARRIVDFVFTTPSPRLTLELAVGEIEECWPTLWFVTQYARRKSEWAKRGLKLVLRTPRAPQAPRLEFLKGHEVSCRLVLGLEGAPQAAKRPAFPARSGLALVAAAAKEPAAWVDWLSRGGLECVRLMPASFESGISGFLGFYAAALDRMISLDSERPLRDEWSETFLKRRSWSVPGRDILAEVAYDADGRIFTSEEGLALGEAGAGLFELGKAGNARYEDFAKAAIVQAAASSSHADNQPLCQQCVYRSFCGLPAAASLRLQGTFWGQTPSSPLCALHMGILDAIFERLKDENARAILERWADLG